MYDFAAEPGNNELTVSEGEIITITNPVRAQCAYCSMNVFQFASLLKSSSAHISVAAVASEILVAL